MNFAEIFKTTTKIIGEAIGTAPVSEAVARHEEVTLINSALEATAQFAAPHMMKLYREAKATEGDAPKTLAASEVVGALAKDTAINVLSMFIGHGDIFATVGTKLALNALVSVNFNTDIIKNIFSRKDSTAPAK